MDIFKLEANQTTVGREMVAGVVAILFTIDFYLS